MLVQKSLFSSSSTDSVSQYVEKLAKLDSEVAEIAFADLLESYHYRNFCESDRAFGSAWSGSFLVVWWSYWSKATNDKRSTVLGRRGLLRDAARQVKRARRRSLGYVSDTGNEKLQLRKRDVVDCLSPKSLRDVADKIDGLPSCSLWHFRAVSSVKGQASFSLIDAVDQSSITSLDIELADPIYSADCAASSDGQLAFASYGIDCD